MNIWKTIAKVLQQAPAHYKDISSAVSRAILEPVYQFGIPNSDPKILKNVRLVLYLFNVQQTNNWSFTFLHNLLFLFSNDL